MYVHVPTAYLHIQIHWYVCVTSAKHAFHTLSNGTTGVDLITSHFQYSNFDKL